MSTTDDKTRTDSEEAAGETTETSDPKSDAKGQDNGAAGPIILFFMVGLAVSMILGWVIFPKLLYSQKKQPIDFNHAMHNELVDEGCESCHFFREDGTYSGVPTNAQCVDCHEEVQGESPDEIKLVEEYIAKDREVPWLVYSKQPDCVFFSHAAHIKGAGMECVTCHGPVGESDHLKVYQENRITGYSRDIWGENIAGFKKNSWDRMKMDDCAACHKENAAFFQRTNVKAPINRFIDNIIEVSFPGTSPAPNKGSSVQTERDACFVCHK
ncbi:menaquinone reductase multiheme cytochrome c subunit QrcA [Thermodesulfobacteriota bacterium]